MKLIFSAALLFSTLLFSCSSKEKTTKLTFNNGDLMYTGSIKELQAKNLGDYLVSCEFFDGKPKTVRIDKQNDTIHFAMILVDSIAYSKSYHDIALDFIGELEKIVFSSNTVVVDFCDDRFNVKKTIRRSESLGAALPVDGLQGAWICENISGGETTDPHQSARDLEVIKTNFTFEFYDDQTFYSDFLNRNNLSQPLKLKGFYTIDNNKISFHHLLINGVAGGEEMQFTLVEKNTSFQLISHNEGVEDLVMTFKKAG